MSDGRTSDGRTHDGRTHDASTHDASTHGAPAPAPSGRERRYDEAEVREILRRAAESETTHDSAGASALPMSPAPSAPFAGFTLADLQRIGADAQLAPDAVTAAARAVALESAWQIERRAETTSLVLSAQMPLPATPDEMTWGRIVAVLREVYGEVGHVTQEGTLRRWRTGSYDEPGFTSALLEPDPASAGWRLRLRVDGADHTSVVGGGFLGLGALAAAVPPLVGASPKFMILGGLIAGCGALIWAAHRTWRPGWEARERARFDAAITRLDQLGLVTAAPPALPDGGERT